MVEILVLQNRTRNWGEELRDTWDVYRQFVTPQYDPMTGENGNITYGIDLPCENCSPSYLYAILVIQTRSSRSHPVEQNRFVEGLGDPQA